MRKTKRCLKKRKSRKRIRKGGNIDARVGLPLPLSDSLNYITTSLTSLKNTISGNYA